MKDKIYSTLIDIIKTPLSADTVKLEGRYLLLSKYPVELLKPFLQACKQNNISDSNELDFDSYESFSVDDFLESSDFNHEKNHTLTEYKIDTAFSDKEILLFQIFQNEQSFIDSYKISISNTSKLDLPIDFYLIDEEYHHASKSGKNAPLSIQRFYKIQSFIKALGKIADFQDTQDGTVLYFRATEKQGHICDLRIDLFKEGAQNLIDLELPNEAFTVTEQIQQLDIGNNLADKEKKFIFSSSISEFLYNKDGNRLIYLIENWNAFTILFNKNYQVYTQGKSLNELKISLAEEQIKLSDNITKGVIDILGKALILPTATAAFLVFRQSIQASGYGVLISVIFCILIIFITLSIVLGTNLHARVVDTLESASKFINNEDKNELEIQDEEYKDLNSKLSTLISKTKTLLKNIRKTSIIFSTLCLAVLIGIQVHDSYLKVTHNKSPFSVLDTSNIHMIQNSFPLITNGSAINTEKYDHTSEPIISKEHDFDPPKIEESPKDHKTLSNLEEEIDTLREDTNDINNPEET